MIIKNSQVELYSQSQSVYKHTSSSSVQMHYSEQNPSNSGNQEDDNIKNNQALSLNFSHYQFSSINSSRAMYSSEDDLSTKDKINKSIIERLLEELMGKKTALHPKKITSTQNQQSIQASSVNINLSMQNPYKIAEKGELRAIVFESSEEYYQKESIDFAAKIKFNTPNKSYDMSLDISFSKEFYEKSSLRVVVGEDIFTDPLVVNFGEDVNPFDNLSSLKFAFDLDNDGATEMIPYLKAGAGYLVLDKNGNGKIDNGNELFGPNSGNGFKELALYDGDKNGFIDEADEVFSKLKIWSFDEKGNSSLISLLDANVGAIYLGDVQSGFKYIDGINSTLASSQSNGIFIKEDGTGLGVANSIDILV